MQDDSQSLLDLPGFSTSSRVLVMRSGPGAAHGQEVKAQALERLSQVLELFAGRDSQRDDGYTLELENQAGESMKLEATDKKAVTLFLGLHQLGRASMSKASNPVAALHRLEPRPDGRLDGRLTCRGTGRVPSTDS